MILSVSRKRETLDTNVTDRAQQGNHEDDSNGKEVRDDDREEDLHRDPLRSLLRSFKSAGPNLSGLDAQDRGETRAHSIRLDDGSDEIRDLLHLDPVG